MADRNIQRWLGHGGLIAIGLILGSFCAPQPSNAQQGATKVGNDFVVIQGYINADGPYYYMVRSDGSAKPISHNKTIIRAPESHQLKLSMEHAFGDAMLQMNHSGSIGQ